VFTGQMQSVNAHKTSGHAHQYYKDGLKYWKIYPANPAWWVGAFWQADADNCRVNAVTQ